MVTLTAATFQIVHVKIPVVATINVHLILELIIPYVQSIVWKEIISM